MQFRNIILSATLALATSVTLAQTGTRDTVRYNHYAGTSLWSLRNLFPNGGDFYELDYGHRLSKKEFLVARAITWKYDAPLGIPFGSPDLGSDSVKYPGYVRAWGLGAGYQHFIYRRLFAAAYATGFIQNFYGTGKGKVQSGFQLFLQAKVGYRFNFFRGKVYFDPAISFNYWPVNTSFPAAFAQKEKDWPDYFLFEPHFNFGINF